MTVTLELPPNLEVELSSRAAQNGQALPDHLLVLAEARASQRSAEQSA